MPSFHEPPDGGKIPIRLPLRLVHPKPPQTPKKKERPHGSRLFTTEEHGRLRAALRAAARAMGTQECLADAMRVSFATIKAAARKGVSAALAIRLARVLGVPLEALLRAPTDATKCVSCGAPRCHP